MKNKITKLIRSICVICGLISGLLFSNTINIPADYSTIQAGLNVASEGDTVLVAVDTYYENIIWPATNSIKLIGEDRETTIIDGDSLASVIRFDFEESDVVIDSTTQITGFTIQNGYAQNYPNYKGGGIYFDNSSPSLADVTISNNSAEYFGGGIYCSLSSPSLVNVTISNNSADSRGGGIYCCRFSSPSLVNVTISNNSADSYGGGIYCYYYSSPSLADVTISNNSADSYGGGIYCTSYSRPSFSAENRCNIYSNNTINLPTGRTGRGIGTDIFASNCPVIDVIVDTFTVMNPTEYHALPLDDFTFDILNAVNPQQVDADLYVSPDGDNSNDGLTAETPLKTIQHATSIILADSTNPHTIHLANGIYSPSTNGEYFPVEVISYVSLVGESEDDVILDAEGVAGVMRCRYVSSSTISYLTLTNGSVSVDGGGGIYCEYSSPNLENVTISGNSAECSGGGIYCNYSSPNLANVTISGNSAEWSGGGISCGSFSSPSLENVTISGNSASSGGGISSSSSSSPSLVNCILWNDAPQEVSVSFGSVNIFYSDIQGGWSGEGNIDLDPFFTDPENGNYTLQPNSPCIDAGTAFFVFEGDTLVNMS
ncbi:MAG: hypothetical protein ISR90_03875, partial [Candidatus Marinimicrobia bacterium]|nr:hypothetical protein [Candidatus Neomarinimicrobiota bacterium]